MVKNIASVVAVSLLIGIAAYAASTEPIKVPAQAPTTVRQTELGFPVVGIAAEDGKVTPFIFKGVVLLLREDGVVGWKLSPDLQKRFERDMKSGKLMELPFTFKLGNDKN